MATMTKLVAGVSTRANLIAYWNANADGINNGSMLIGGLTVGYGAGGVTTNTACGVGTLGASTTGGSNTAVGWTALAANTTGTNNTAVGTQALVTCTAGTDNVAVGVNALRYMTTGIKNTAVGRDSLTANTTGTLNTALGYAAGNAITTGSNVACLGYNAQASGATTTNEIVLGDANIARLRCQVTTITALSDRRDKANIQDLPLGLTFLKTVRPVQFRWALRPEIRTTLENGDMGPVIGYGPQPEPGRKDIGFISQELDDAEIAAGINWLGLAFKANPQRLESTSGKLLPVAIKAIQELSALVDTLTARVAALEPV